MDLESSTQTMPPLRSPVVPLSARVEVVSSADQIPEGVWVVAMRQGGYIPRGRAVGWRVIRVWDDETEETGAAVHAGLPGDLGWQVVGLVPACEECWGAGLQAVVDPLNEDYMRFIPELCLLCGGTGERCQT